MTTKRNQRKLLPNIGWPAERYFMILQFILLMSAMVYLLYLIFGTIKEVSETLSPAQQASLANLFDRIDFLLLIRISILFCVVFFVNVLLGLFFLHRVTGPLVRIRGVLTKIAGGDVPNMDVILRKGDFPTDVADALTDALKKIRFWQRIP